MRISIDREGLNDFLVKNGCKNTDAMMREIEPFFKIAEAGQYTMAPEKEIDQEALAKAISLATGKSVQKIAIVSASKPSPRVADDVYSQILGASLGDSPLFSFRDSPLFSFRDSLLTSLGASLWNNLVNSLEENLCNSLWNSLHTNIWDNLLNDSLLVSLGDGLWNSLWTNLAINLGNSLFYYIGFNLGNKPEEADKLKPLLKQLTKCLILGAKKDEEGTWLVLVA